MTNKPAKKKVTFITPKKYLDAADLNFSGYPRGRTIVRLRRHLCPRCLRNLHKAPEQPKGTYYCTCTPELLIDL